MISSEDSSQQPSHLFKSPCVTDIVHGENALRDVPVVNHGQVADLSVRHGESFVDFVVGLARDDLLCRDLVSSEVSQGDDCAFPPQYRCRGQSLLL